MSLSVMELLRMSSDEARVARCVRGCEAQFLLPSLPVALFAFFLHRERRRIDERGWSGRFLGTVVG